MGKLVWELASAVRGLQLAEHTCEDLYAAHELLAVQMKRLASLEPKLAMRMKEVGRQCRARVHSTHNGLSQAAASQKPLQVDEELHRVSKAQTYGSAKGTKKTHVVLTAENTMCSRECCTRAGASIV